MIGNTLQLLLANLFDKFKAQSPLLAGIIMLVLGMINYGAAYGVEAGVFTIEANSFAAKAIYVVTLVWGLMQGSRTSNLLATNKAVSTETQTPAVLREQSNVEIQDIQEPVIIIQPAVPEKGSILDLINKQRIGAKV